ncbi:MAG: hypothetical protein AB8G16_14065 [Gammaproteobacteria bacterium]
MVLPKIVAGAVAIVACAHFSLFSASAQSCKRTSEYKVLAKVVRTYYKSNRAKCEDSVAQYFRQMAIAKCEAEKRGKGVAGDCEHLATFEAAALMPENAYEHCEVYEPDIVERYKFVDDYAKENGIDKCEAGEGGASND